MRTRLSFGARLSQSRRVMTVRFAPALAITATLAALALTTALASASTKATLQLRKTKVGTILVDSTGYTLYAYSADRRNVDVCATIPSCLMAWPALLSRHPTAGPGVRRRLIGTIYVKGVGTQVTYGGHPLYTYYGDNGPGATDYINVYGQGGYWPAVNAAGRLVK